MVHERADDRPDHRRMSTEVNKVVDGGLSAGPRIHACGGLIPQTSGHGDLRLGSSNRAQQSKCAELGISSLGDGPDAMTAVPERTAPELALPNGQAAVAYAR